jgi:drug/metabolite transporter (DMT)-like permease
MVTTRRAAAAAAASSSSSSPAAVLACAAAGALGALAASAGKLSGAPEVCPVLFAGSGGGGDPLLIPAWLTPQLACRWSFLLALLVCNLSATGLLLKALSSIPSLRATVLSNAANIAATGALGALLFGEPITPRWLAGVATVGAGLWLIGRAAVPEVVAPTSPAPRARKSATPQRRRSTRSD